MKKDRINVREVGLNIAKKRRAITHNYRLRNDLKNVDYASLDDEYYSLSTKGTRTEMNEHLKRHRKLYKREFGEKLREDRINSFKELLITFPASFRHKYDDGEITKKQFLDCVKIFISEYEKQTKLKVISYQLHTAEKTPHFHILSTQFLDNGRTFKKKNYKSYLQELGGYAFSSMGLRRGNKKNVTKDTYKSSSKHYEEVLRQGDKLDEIMNNDLLSLENIDNVIKQAVKPFKTLLTYIKRSLKKEAEAEYVLKQHERALAQFHNQFPALSTIKTFDEMIHYLENNKTKFKNIKPKG